MSKTEKSLADKWYTDLIVATEGPLSELERNAEFVTRLFHRDIPAGLPELTTFPHTRVRSRVDGNYFIVFPGAAWSGRRWPVQHFVAVARRIQMEHGWLPVACGSEADGALCDEVVRLTGGHAVNLAGSTTLPEFSLLVRSARILIGNETSAVHIANAVGTPSICVLGGGHFGRFLPYPNTLPGHKPVVVYQPMECFGCNWRCVKLHTAGNPVPCIANITVEKVIDAVDSEISRLPVEA